MPVKSFRASIIMTFDLKDENTFNPNEAILCHRYESLLVQVMTGSISGLVLAGLAPSQ